MIRNTSKDSILTRTLLFGFLLGIPTSHFDDMSKWGQWVSQRISFEMFLGGLGVQLIVSTEVSPWYPSTGSSRTTPCSTWHERVGERTWHLKSDKTSHEQKCDFGHFLFSFWYSRKKRVIPGSKWLPLMDSYAAVASLQKLYEIISETTFESTLRLNEGRILQHMKKGSMVFGCGAWLTWIMLYPFRRSQATYSLTPKISWQVVAYNHPWLVVTRHNIFPLWEGYMLRVIWIRHHLWPERNEK